MKRALKLIERQNFCKLYDVRMYVVFQTFENRPSAKFKSIRSFGLKTFHRVLIFGWIDEYKY